MSGGKFLFLVGAVAQPCCGHAFLDSAFGHEIIFKISDITHHHLVGHAAQCVADISHFLIAPGVEIGFIIFNIVVLTAELQHTIEAVMA